MKFRDYINESKDRIIFVKDELWVTYAQGSGQTAQLPDIKNFLSDDSSDSKHYDSLVPKILKWSKANKPLKTNKDKSVKLFEISTYPLVSMGKKYDIFGGDVKSDGKIYMVVTEEKNTIINFFKSKNEAINWVGSIK